MCIGKPKAVLSLNASGPARFQEVFDLGDRHHVVVALDGVLERRSSHGKFDGTLRVFAGEQRINKPCTERIAVSGNLRYIGSERNFNPMMAMAADTVVAGVSEIVEAGQIGADYVETPGIFVDYLVGGAE